jgi:hypothetical protein
VYADPALNPATNAHLSVVGVTSDDGVNAQVGPTTAPRSLAPPGQTHETAGRTNDRRVGVKYLKTKYKKTKYKDGTSPPWVSEGSAPPEQEEGQERNDEKDQVPGSAPSSPAAHPLVQADAAVLAAKVTITADATVTRDGPLPDWVADLGPVSYRQWVIDAIRSGADPEVFRPVPAAKWEGYTPGTWEASA